MNERLEFAMLTAHAAALFSSIPVDDVPNTNLHSLPHIYQRLETVDRVWAWTGISKGKPDMILVKAALFYKSLDLKILTFDRLKNLVGEPSAEIVRSLSLSEFSSSYTRLLRSLKENEIDRLLLEIASALSREGTADNLVGLLSLFNDRQREIKDRLNERLAESIRDNIIVMIGKLS
jgi:hypothetical protein